MVYEDEGVSPDIVYEDEGSFGEFSVPPDYNTSQTIKSPSQPSLHGKIIEEEDQESSENDSPVLRVPIHKPTVNTDSLSDIDMNKTLLKITVEIEDGKHGEIVVR